MEIALFVAVVMLSVLCLLSLLLNFGVIRRLRTLEERIAAQAVDPFDGTASGPLFLEAGGPVPAVTFTDGAGRAHTTATLAPTIYGFFGPQCSTCHERLPEFLAYAAAQSGSVVSVVVRDGGDTEHLVRDLSPVGIVSVEDLGGPLTAAFQVSAFPVFATVDSAGVVQFTGYTLPQTVA